MCKIYRHRCPVVSWLRAALVAKETEGVLKDRLREIVASSTTLPASIKTKGMDPLLTSLKAEMNIGLALSRPISFAPTLSYSTCRGGRL